MLDTYWNFGEACDHYLGRILSILYPRSSDFGVLPLHFTVSSENTRVQGYFNFCLGKMVEVETARKSDGNTFVKALLSQCLESLIFHSYELHTIMSSRPYHPFSNIPIFKIQSYWNY